MRGESGEQSLQSRHVISLNQLMAYEYEYEAIGRRLRHTRQGLSDLTQKAWAEKNGFNPTQYNNWEKGARRIPIEAAIRLADIYGLTLDAIYRGRLDGLPEDVRKILLCGAEK